MTKEELEKEAEEYAIGLFPNDVFKQSAVIQGIIKFTEPREKRIEELEKENEKLRNNGFTVSAMTEQQLKVAIEKGEQLEQENTELDIKRKAERQIFQGIVEKKNEQLTKAKEIIREYMRFEPVIGTCSFYSEEYEKTKKKAEQFLKEGE